MGELVEHLDGVAQNTKTLGRNVHMTALSCSFQHYVVFAAPSRVSHRSLTMWVPVVARVLSPYICHCACLRYTVRTTWFAACVWRSENWSFRWVSNAYRCTSAPQCCNNTEGRHAGSTQHLRQLVLRNRNSTLEVVRSLTMAGLRKWVARSRDESDSVKRKTNELNKGPKNYLRRHYFVYSAVHCSSREALVIALTR